MGSVHHRFLGYDVAHGPTRRVQACPALCRPVHFPPSKGELLNQVQTYIVSEFDHPQGVFAPLFETAIRYLGGLLSAYALSREQILLTRADDLGRMLSPAFNTSSGFPLFGVNTNS